MSLDAHKNISVVTRTNEQGKVVEREKIGTDKEKIEKFFHRKRKGSHRPRGLGILL